MRKPTKKQKRTPAVTVKRLVRHPVTLADLVAAAVSAGAVMHVELEPIKKMKDTTWQPTPMPLKTIQMLWDGESIWGPVAPQDVSTRDAIQAKLKPTHWLAIPPAPMPNK